MITSNLHPDTHDLLLALNSHRIPYLIIGAHALSFHGYHRPTRDLDLFIDPTADPIPALTAFGIPDLTTFPTDSILRYGTPPHRIDLTNVIEHLSFSTAWPNRVPGDFYGVPVHFIGLADLWYNKIHARRAKDHMDAIRLVATRSFPSLPIR